MHARTIIFVAGVAVGIIAGLSSPFASELAVAAIVLAGVQAALYMFERKRKTGGLALSLYTALFSFAFFVGVVRAQLVEERLPYVCDGTCTIEGTVVSSPEKKDAYQTFTLRPDERAANMYDVQIRAPLYPAYAIGETMRVHGKATEPSIVFPHGDKKSFDYESYLNTKNIGSEMLFPKIERLGDGDLATTATLGRWKESLVADIDTYVSSPASSLASGMLFGNSSMSKELTDTFRTAGLSHIVVLSGFNIAIVIAFILFVFAFLPPVLRVALATVAVTSFVLMVGGEASVIRATLMSFVGLLAMLLGREYVARQALLLSLFAIVMYDPTSLIDSVSLHLSFLATAGIVYASEPIKAFIARFVTQKFFTDLATTTFAAYFATLPYLMHTFGTVSVYALLTNMLVLPLVPLAMLLSFAVVAASVVSHTLALLVGALDTFFIDTIIYVARAAEDLPFSRLPFSIPFAAMVFMYAVLLVFIFYLSHKKKDETPFTDKDGFLTDTIPY